MKTIPRAKLFKTKDGPGYRWYLVNGEDSCISNPHLIIANKKHKRKTMAKTIVMHRNRKGQFVKGRASNPKHHKKAKHHKSNQMLSNRRHHRKSNPTAIPLPGIGRVQFPVATVIGVTAGLALPPLVQGFVTPYFPSYAAQYPIAFRLASNFAVLGGAYMIGGRTATRDVFVGEVAGWLVQQIQSASGMIAGTGMGNPRFFPYGAGRVVGARGMRGYTGPVSRYQMSGYTRPTSRLSLAAPAGLYGGISQINQRVKGTRFRSRFQEF